MIGPKVLLAEDDADLRTLFRIALQQAGFSVREAGDGLEAIGLVQIEAFDAVVLDISMPRIDGCSALSTFRRLRNGEDVPVVVVTALIDPAIRQRALDSGAVEFLEKPIAPDDLVEAVRRHVTARQVPV